MKKTLNIANILSNIAFLAMMFYLVLIINSLHISVYNELNESNIILSIYAILAVGIIAIILNNVLLNSSHARTVIYVDKAVESGSVESLSSPSIVEERIDFLSLHNKVDSVAGANLTLADKFDKILSILCAELNAGQGIVYTTVMPSDKSVLKQIASYAYAKDRLEVTEFEYGEGLVGLAAKENKIISIDNVPDSYLNIYSGLGKTSPKHILILPLKFEDNVVGVMELALMWSPNASESANLSRLSDTLGQAMIERLKANRA